MSCTWSFSLTINAHAQNCGTQAIFVKKVVRKFWYRKRKKFLLGEKTCIFMKKQCVFNLITGSFFLFGAHLADNDYLVQLL